MSVSTLTYGNLLETPVFGWLGELFPDALSSRGFLEGLGAKPEKLVAFGSPLSAEDYWQAVCREVGYGRFHFDLEDLLRAVLLRNPRHEGLRGFLHGTGLGELTVLCLLAGPSDSARTRLDVEHREIESVVAHGRRVIRLRAHPATRVQDIIGELLAADPDIVHFAGHASKDGHLVFENDQGQAALVSLRTLADVFDGPHELEGIVLSACHAARYADVLLRHARWVIGAESGIDGPCATLFSVGFYQALAAGLGVRDAFTKGRARMGLGDCDPGSMRLLGEAP